MKRFPSLNHGYDFNQVWYRFHEGFDWTLGENLCWFETTFSMNDLTLHEPVKHMSSTASSSATSSSSPSGSTAAPSSGEASAAAVGAAVWAAATAALNMLSWELSEYGSGATWLELLGVVLTPNSWSIKDIDKWVVNATTHYEPSEP